MHTTHREPTLLDAITELVHRIDTMTVADKLTAAAYLCHAGKPVLARTVAQIAIDEIAALGRTQSPPVR